MAHRPGTGCPGTPDWPARTRSPAAAEVRRPGRHRGPGSRANNWVEVSSKQQLNRPLKGSWTVQGVQVHLTSSIWATKNGAEGLGRMHADSCFCRPAGRMRRFFQVQPHPSRGTGDSARRPVPPPSQPWLNRRVQWCMPPQGSAEFVRRNAMTCWKSISPGHPDFRSTGGPGAESCSKQPAESLARQSGRLMRNSLCPRAPTIQGYGRTWGADQPVHRCSLSWNPWRRVEVTRTGAFTKARLGQVFKQLVDADYRCQPDSVLVLVMDILHHLTSTLSSLSRGSSFGQSFEALRIAKSSWRSTTLPSMAVETGYGRD